MFFTLLNFPSFGSYDDNAGYLLSLRPYVSIGYSLFCPSIWVLCKLLNNQHIVECLCGEKLGFIIIM
jgi:hypothetical protein